MSCRETIVRMNARLFWSFICMCCFVISNRIYTTAKGIEANREDPMSEHHRRQKRSEKESTVTVSKKMREVITETLLSMNAYMDKKPMETMSLTCRNKATRVILYEYPFSEVRWKHNGENLVIQPARMLYNRDSLTIQNLVPKDSGVYHCQINPGDPKHLLVVAVYAVVVGEEWKHVTPGFSFSLKCNSFELGKVFNGTVRYWTHNGEMFSEKPATDKSDDTFSNTTDADGNWLCETFDKETKRKWPVARYKIIVDPPPNLMKKLRIYVIENKVEAFLIVSGGFFIVVVIINLFVSLLERKKNNIQKELANLKIALGIPEAASTAEEMALLMEFENESLTDTEPQYKNEPQDKNNAAYTTYMYSESAEDSDDDAFKPDLTTQLLLN